MKVYFFFGARDLKKKQKSKENALMAKNNHKRIFIICKVFDY